MAEVVTADGEGIARLEVQAPGAACGRAFIQAIDLATCATTNVVGL